MTLDESLKKIFYAIMEEEGGYVNDKDDPGGATNMGVTIVTLRELYRNNRDEYIEIVGSDKPPNTRTVKALTVDQVYKIFARYYLLPLIPLRLPIPLLVEVVDFAFNAGVAQAVRTFQRVVNELGMPLRKSGKFTPLSVDGQIGPKTLKATRLVYGIFGNEAFLRKFRKQRVKFYTELAIAKPHLQKFLRGWTRRANRVKI